MADKEKRILITKCSSHCHALRVSCDHFDDKDGMYCDKSGKWVRITEKDCAKCKAPVLLGLSRSESIERMAKAIRKKLFKNECPTQKIKEEWLEQEYNRYVDFMCKYIAEVALNALLEDKK